MNRISLIKIVARKTNLTKAVVERAVNAIFDTIESALASGEKVQILGFGVFGVVEKTNLYSLDGNFEQDTDSEHYYVLSFKAYQEFKKAVNKKNTVSPQKRIRETAHLKNYPRNIDFHDFLVRTSIFTCRNHNHFIENINGKIKLLMPSGIIQEVNVSAGYCPNCDIYFLLESTYQHLKSRGTILCRITDTKTYLAEQSYLSGGKIAKESILMQYGYSVSQTKMISEPMRHCILGLMIDEHILSKVEIINYLDFFINQRKNISQYKIAIQKWRSDREFVRAYKLHNSRSVDIKAIKR